MVFSCTICRSLTRKHMQSYSHVTAILQLPRHVVRQARRSPRSTKAAWWVSCRYILRSRTLPLTPRACPNVYIGHSAIVGTALRQRRSPRRIGTAAWASRVIAACADAWSVQ